MIISTFAGNISASFNVIEGNRMRNIAKQFSSSSKRQFQW
jgi:hypothetical protein